MARFRVVTKHQISGWRFLLRRIEHALVRRDVSMIDDPQRGRSTALSIGIVLACVVVAGAAVMAFFKPAKQVGNAEIVAEKQSGALYVRLKDRLYPTLNLASARLITGRAETPVQVSQEEIDKYPRGPLLGIPGAPDTLLQGTSRDSSWAVCDTARTGADRPVDPATGLPTTAGSAVHTIAIGGPVTVDGSTTRELRGNQARLLRNDSTTWLIYNDGDRGVVRAAVDLADSPVTMALGIDVTRTIAEISPGLLATLPEVPPLRVPDIPGSGSTTTLSSGLTVPVGSVLSTSAPDGGSSYYLVSETGLVQVNTLVAGIVRNADSHGTASATTVGPDVVASNLRPGGWPGTEDYPTGPVELVDPGRDGVTCYHWSRGAGDAQAATRLLIGRQLPLAAEARGRAVGLVTASSSHGTTADSAYLPGGAGRFVQVTGADPASPLRESLFWISDSGVRYGIDVSPGDSGDQTLQALGLRSPVPAPWSVVSLFAVGPVLSQSDARIKHDGIAPDRSGARLPKQAYEGTS